jgi:hypothetical protein
MHHLDELMLARGQPEQAARLLGAAAQTQVSMGVVSFALPPHLAAQREHVIAHGRQELGQAACAAAFAAGGALTLDEALAEVFTPML